MLQHRRSGLGSSAAAMCIARLSLYGSLEERAVSAEKLSPKTSLVVAADSIEAEKLLGDLKFFTATSDTQGTNESIEVHSFFSWEVLPFDSLSPASAVSSARLATLFRLANNLPTIIVSTSQALLQRLVRPEILLRSALELQVGQDLDRDVLVHALDRGGYSRSSLVEESGQMAVRGAVVDFFPPGADAPIRAELFGDELEGLRTFSTEDQRSISEISSVAVIPAREFFFWPGEEEPGRDSFIQEALQRLKNRASELSIPQLQVRPIEEALTLESSWPGLEHLQPLLQPDLGSFFDYLPEDASVFVWDEQAALGAADDYQALIGERAERAQQEGRLFPEPSLAYQGADDFERELSKRSSFYFDKVSVLGGSLDDDETGVGEQSFGPRIVSNSKLLSNLYTSSTKERPFKPLVEELNSKYSQGTTLAITVSNVKRAERIEELLSGYEVDTVFYEAGFLAWFARQRERRKTKVVYLLPGFLSSGFSALDERIQLISETELFPEHRRRVASVSPGALRAKKLLGTATQLKEDDFVVHLDYGIGIYRGLRVLTVEEKEADFLELEYAEGAKLYVPVENIGKVQKYSAAEGKKPTLTKLGGQSWEKAKKKVQKNVAELAGQLLTVMAKRQIATRQSFGEVDEDDLAFADLFPYVETADQSSAISEVLADLGREKPMDRLVCGDVGYGKTEVALRAAFKVVNSGAQVALLVPTTVLAEQHFETFSERFSSTAVTVGCLSRFYTTAQNRETLRRVAEGQIDIVIGTHRLFQRDVVFKNLGLMIIDEEHRFGVAHKEKLKRFRASVDVLTLTATPIPRTLHMSLAGIRDLSLIETPPSNRQLIRTYISAYDEQIVREALLRELGRGGQAFYINNRVQNIAAVANELREIVPEARIAFAHGQMKERELEQIMRRFVSHEIDVLVSTTIVESGLDIPNANTIIIRRADMFGLAELYQLRGRVGRSSRRAYAYLLIPELGSLGDAARKRLQVLQSLDDLGVGFRLATHDMEIRGAGNLLGSDQSGQIHAVGYELYSKILKNAVRELRRKEEMRLSVGTAEVELPEVDPELNIGFPAHIPVEYIPDVAERLLLYQRLTQIESKSEGRLLGEEIEDRFGQAPDEVRMLVEVMIFRAVLKQAAITTATYRGATLSFSFHREAKLEIDRLIAAAKDPESGIRLSPSMSISVSVGEQIEHPSQLERALAEVLSCLGISIPED